MVAAEMGLVDLQRANIVYNANGSDVTHILIDGRVVVEDGRCTMIDEPEALAACQRAANVVWERARALFHG